MSTYAVTQRMLGNATPVLEEMRRQLHTSGTLDVNRLERALGACWNVGCRELRDLALDLARTRRYRFVAAYYMENSNGRGQRVPPQFRGALARLYGADTYSSPEYRARREQFWAGMETLVS
jgi:hypothetical protein